MSILIEGEFCKKESIGLYSWLVCTVLFTARGWYLGFYDFLFFDQLTKFFKKKIRADRISAHQNFSSFCFHYLYSKGWDAAKTKVMHHKEDIYLNPLNCETKKSEWSMFEGFVWYLKFAGMKQEQLNCATRKLSKFMQKFLIEVILSILQIENHRVSRPCEHRRHPIIIMCM